MTAPLYALVDANHFYVSCERVFRPSLCGRGVVVLSNNGGRALARSNEAKILGIKMGTPWLEIRKKLPEGTVMAQSANFGCTATCRNRMMSLAAGLGPAQEIYGIDESFIDVAGARRRHRRPRPADDCDGHPEPALRPRHCCIRQRRNIWPASYVDHAAGPQDPRLHNLLAEHAARDRMKRNIDDVLPAIAAAALRRRAARCPKSIILAMQLPRPRAS